MTLRVRFRRAATSAVLISSVMAAAGAASASAQTAGFDDVPDDAYYSAPVTELAADGIFEGTLCEEGFCPAEPIDRKTMAVWIVRTVAAEDPAPISQSRFEDVDPDSFHGPFIERMAELEITTGCGDGTRYCPDHTVTRAQMAVFLSRAFHLADAESPGFEDVPADAWYAAHVARLAASGITAGCGDGSMFCPGRDTTRAQMATFLHRAASQHATAPVALNPAMDGGGVIAGACAVRSDGALVCWGSGEEVVEGTYRAVNADTSYHSCAIRADDSVECWTYDGMLGAPPGAFAAVTSAQALFPIGEEFPEIFSCGIRIDGTLTCWQSLEGGGYSDAPQCEDVEWQGLVFSSCQPNILMPPQGMFKAISRACAIAMDGTISCWNPYYYFDDVEVHGAPPDGGTYKALSLGSMHSCAIRTDDTLTCWGEDAHGKLESPAGQFKAVSSGQSHSCAIRMDDTLTCWGANEYGQSDAPAGEFIAVSAESNMACAIGADNTITCWGVSYDPDLVNPRQPPEGSFGPG